MSVVLTTTIDIDASTAEVWDVLTDFPSYGQWSNFSRIVGVAEQGSRLTMRMPGMSFTSTLTAVTPLEHLQWAAKIISEGVFHAQHSFALSANADGTTRLSNTETFSGALARPFEPLFSHNKDTNGYAAFNRALKQRVELRASKATVSQDA